MICIVTIYSVVRTYSTCTNTILMYIVHSTSVLHLAGYTVNIIGCICIHAIFYLDLYMHFAHEMYVTIIILIFH